MADYARLAATARRLVEKNGRPVVFVRLAETPADEDKPWRGATDPRTPPEVFVDGHAVAVPPSSASQLGLGVADSDFVKRAEQILIAVADGDIEDFDEVVDGSVRWRIQEVEKLKPADTTLLFFVSVRR